MKMKQFFNFDEFFNNKLDWIVQANGTKCYSITICNEFFSLLLVYFLHIGCGYLATETPTLTEH